MAFSSRQQAASSTGLWLPLNFYPSMNSSRWGKRRRCDPNSVHLNTDTSVDQVYEKTFSLHRARLLESYVFDVVMSCLSKLEGGCLHPVSGQIFLGQLLTLWDWNCL